VRKPVRRDNVDDLMARRPAGEDAPQQVADEMHGPWVRFIGDGDPGWPAYDLADRATRDFGGTEAVVNDPMAAERELWNGVL
jgi:carboxylesterase type B